LFVLWHGYGWRVDDLSTMRRELNRRVGDCTEPNPCFRWQAFGELDRQYRIEHSLFAPDNVVALGSAYSDLLLPGSVMRQTFQRPSVQEHYRIDLSRPTVLLGLTWHHGAALSHWGDDHDLLQRLVVHLEKKEVNLLFRLHDRSRYEKKYLDRLARVSDASPHVELKFKSESPDSLVDFLVSDVLISNYSSLLNAFYYTERATLHIDPRGPGQDTYYRKLKFGRVWKWKSRDPRATWKFEPTDIGGLRVDTFEGLLDGIDQALTAPDCCVSASRSYVARHITQCDGATRERMRNWLQAWLTS